MAETLQHKVGVDTSILFTDNSGTPKTYPVICDSDPVLTNAGYEHVTSMLADGTMNRIVRKGPQAGTSKLELDCLMYGAGDHASDVALVDFLNNAGLYVSGWTGTQSPSDFKQFDVRVTLAAKNGVAGGYYELQDCWFSPGTQVTFGKSGIRIKGTLESPDAYATTETVAP